MRASTGIGRPNNPVTQRYRVWWRHRASDCWIRRNVVLQNSRKVSEDKSYMLQYSLTCFLPHSQSRHSILFTVACPAVISLWSPHQSITISPSELVGVLEHEIGECVQSALSDVLQSKGFSITQIAAGSKCRRARDKLEMYGCDFQIVACPWVSIIHVFFS